MGGETTVSTAVPPGDRSQSRSDPDPPSAPATSGYDARTVVSRQKIFVAYFCGGYVAGRMARFNGARQGIGVWLWALIAAVVVAVLAAITGNQLDASRYFDGGPQIPASRAAHTASGIITAPAVLAVALIGAIVGGLAGMRFHRRVDRAGEAS
jgi:hypothetical protein